MKAALSPSPTVTMWRSRHFHFVLVLALLSQSQVDCRKRFSNLLPSPPPPYSHVDANLRSLAGAAEGFGHGSIGGLEGSVYHVTTLNERGPGSLREACGLKEPLWIVFDVSGTISLTSAIRVTSHKTIDGRGQRIKLTGNGLSLLGSEHVIINNLEFHGGHDDAIAVRHTSNVWIDRCTLSNYTDGLIDITKASTQVTVSRCLFYNHKKTMLISASPRDIEDRNSQVTVHHCFFDRTVERHPRVRFAKVHIYNNYYKRWGLYAVRASVESQIVSQNNVYEAGDSKRAFDYLPEKASDSDTKDDGTISSQGDVFLNGAQSDVKEQSPSRLVFLPQKFYTKWTVQPAGPKLLSTVSQIAGSQDIPLPEDDL